jgi:hypothetical protein
MALSKILFDSIDLTGSGNTTTSNIIVTSNTTTGNLLVTGNTTTGNLLVTGNVTVSTSVAVTRNVSTSNIIVSNLATTSNLLVTGNTTTGNLTVTGAVTGSLAGGTGLPLTTGVTGTLPVANGGTGAATLTANNVVLGAGTSAVTFVAPGTTGNVLVSNGTNWTSGGAGVTSAVAGNGITVSAATGAVTISQDFYTGSSATNTSFPIGSYMVVNHYTGNADTINLNAAISGLYIVNSGGGTALDSVQGATNLAVSGTWRMRGARIYGGCGAVYVLAQRTA